MLELCSPPRIAVLTAGCKGLFQYCKKKVNVVVVVVVVVVVTDAKRGKTCASES